MKPSLGTVVDVLEAAVSPASRLQAQQAFRLRGGQVVVPDGGSQDGGPAIARGHADLPLQAPLGRTSQMNAGAAACAADMLLFLHADTALTTDADMPAQRVGALPTLWDQNVPADLRRVDDLGATP